MSAPPATSDETLALNRRVTTPFMQEKTQREAAKSKQSGRTMEIQRLIGRSLRSVVDLAALGEIERARTPHIMGEMAVHLGLEGGALLRPEGLDLLGRRPG